MFASLVESTPARVRAADWTDERRVPSVTEMVVVAMVGRGASCARDEVEWM